MGSGPSLPGVPNPGLCRDKWFHNRRKLPLENERTASNTLLVIHQMTRMKPPVQVLLGRQPVSGWANQWQMKGGSTPEPACSAAARCKYSSQAATPFPHWLRRSTHWRVWPDLTGCPYRQQEQNTSQGHQMVPGKGQREPTGLWRQLGRTFGNLSPTSRESLGWYLASLE